MHKTLRLQKGWTDLTPNGRKCKFSEKNWIDSCQGGCWGKSDQEKKKGIANTHRSVKISCHVTGVCTLQNNFHATKGLKGKCEPVFSISFQIRSTQNVPIKSVLVMHDDCRPRPRLPAVYQVPLIMNERRVQFIFQTHPTTARITTYTRKCEGGRP